MLNSRTYGSGTSSDSTGSGDGHDANGSESRADISSQAVDEDDEATLNDVTMVSMSAGRSDSVMERDFSQDSLDRYQRRHTSASCIEMF